MPGTRTAQWERLLAVTRARTLLAVCHEAWCDEVDGRPVEPSTVGMLAVRGQPHLVATGTGPWYAAGTRLRLVVVLDDLGVVTVTGTLQPPVSAGQDPGLALVLEEHQGCLREPLPLPHVLAFPLELHAVRVVGPGEEAAQVLDPGVVQSAEPDWLLANAAQVVAHLEADHAAELVRLARGRGASDASSVAVRQLSRHGVQLACLGPDGVTALDLVFDPPVAEPSQLWRHLEAARP